MTTWWRWLVWATVATAGAWSAVLIWAAGSIDLYSGVSQADDGTVTTSGATLVEVNGPFAYAVGIVPLFATITVALLAALRPHLAPAVAALGVVGVLGILNLLAMLTVGILVVPATASLLVAAVAMVVRASAPGVAPGRAPRTGPETGERHTTRT